MPFNYKKHQIILIILLCFAPLVNNAIGRDLVDNCIIYPVDTSLSNNYEIIYDTVYVAADTIRKTDTVKVFVEHKPEIQYSFELSSSPFLSTVNINPTTESFAPYAYRVNQARSTMPGYRIDGNLKVQKRNQAIYIGIGFLNYRELQTYSLNYKIPHITQYSKLDTIDSYFVVRGSDTSLVAVTKEQLYTRTDTIVELRKNELKNNLVFIEIPLVYGYHISLGRSALELKTGIECSFLIHKKIRTISNDGLFIKDMSKLNVFSNLTIALWLSCSIQYPINENVHIIIEPWFMNRINSSYHNNYLISEKLQLFGIKLGCNIAIN
jgi:hypothetical protein